ncbi:MAG: AMP-binding protein, partial [Hymenobacter sp.]|nr:AMP-binding protein [Hymenobacter sp.]
MGTNYFETIHATLLRQPDQVCLVWPAAAGEPAAAVAYTGRALLNGVEAYREKLLARGVQPGMPVLLALPMRPELICALLAVMALGAVPVLPPAAASP